MSLGRGLFALDWAKNPVPNFAANLSLLFAEHAFLDRFERAAAAGFTAVECQFPYGFEKQAMAEALARNRLTQVLLNLPAGDWAAGERGIAILPERVSEFRNDLELAIGYATVLGCIQVNCLSGLAPDGIGLGLLHDTLVENLVYAAGRLKQAGIRLLIEPINTHDLPGFFLSGTQQALDVIAAVGSDNLFVQYDVYHMHRMGEDVPATLRANLDRIAHLQIADAPGRHEPGTGEIDFSTLFEKLDALGYQGWIGCEYLPKAGTEEGLGWLEPWRNR